MMEVQILLNYVNCKLNAGTSVVMIHSTKLLASNIWISPSKLPTTKFWNEWHLKEDQQ